MTVHECYCSDAKINYSFRFDYSPDISAGKRAKSTPEISKTDGARRSFNARSLVQALKSWTRSNEIGLEIDGDVLFCLLGPVIAWCSVSCLGIGYSLDLGVAQAYVLLRSLRCFLWALKISGYFSCLGWGWLVCVGTVRMLCNQGGIDVPRESEKERRIQRWEGKIEDKTSII
ncbi:hypothetical protein Tco_0792232 [Tanacetum coccineum]